MKNLSELYSFLWTVHGNDFGALDQSLSPRSPEYAFELTASAGVRENSLVVDAGCGRGTHCAELINRFGCRAIGIDIVFEPLKAASHPSLEVIQGSIELLPIKNDSVD